MKVAYVFTSPRAASYKLGQMILPQMEAGTHGVEVVGMFFFDDNVFVLRQGDAWHQTLPTGTAAQRIAMESQSPADTASETAKTTTPASSDITIRRPGISASPFQALDCSGPLDLASCPVAPTMSTCQRFLPLSHKLAPLCSIGPRRKRSTFFCGAKTVGARRRFAVATRRPDTKLGLPIGFTWHTANSRAR